MSKDTYLCMCDAIIAHQAHTRAEHMRRILRVVGETGPRSRNILAGLCDGVDTKGGTLDTMIACGMLVAIGERRGTVYGTPDQARAAKRKAA